MSQQTHAFQAEVKQLLHLVAHSLYSNKEIFLRELISNASDACDKLRFLALDDADVWQGQGELEIRIDFDPEKKTITISDTGVGMSEEEAINNLGTIAKSGTREFVEKMTQKNKEGSSDAKLIGQFGVGFYSSYVVADRVTVESRRAGEPAEKGVRWESDGTGEFTMATIPLENRGTAITLHLREGEDDFLSDWRLRSVSKKYSDHISLPIKMRKETWDEEEKKSVRTDEWETVNHASALWARPKSELSDSDYHEFFKQSSYDSDEPLAYSHNRVEGLTEYTQLLFVPSKAPADLWNRENRGGIKLYVNRVFIMDDAEALMPIYLRFVRGVVDANNLPLNVSRELLQESRDIKQIREGCTKRVLSMLEDLAANQGEKYLEFWREFGQTLKEGLGEDFSNRERLSKLLRFPSTEGDELTSLSDYVARMKDGQEAIYYVTGETNVAAKQSPQLEVFKKKGIEVLLLTDRVDEWMLSYLDKFDDKDLKSVAKGGVELGELQDSSEKEAGDEKEKKHEALVETMGKVLGDKVQSVKVSARLVDSASCLVVEEGQLSGHLQRILKQAGQDMPESKPVLEINVDHPLLGRINRELIADAEGNEAFKEFSELLYEQALLAEGGMLENPAAFVQRVNRLLV